MTEPEAAPVPSVLPRGDGHHFVLYGDSCSGIAGALHERNFAAINEVLRRLDPPPQFILFPGDEIMGLTADPEALRSQWRHWLDNEMGWLDRSAIPLWHATGNHTVYDGASERIFAEVLQHLPRNEPPGQQGLAYWVRRGDLLLIFVNTLWSGLGGEGRVETEWLRETLERQGAARHKLVIGHHPAHPINGFSGAYQREIGPEHAEAFWDILVEHKVPAYLCSHILAFDAQVHRGVLQICTAGAGTAHRMPEGVEYLHLVQLALDADGLRCQVLDIEGRRREQIAWPFELPPQGGWRELPAGESEAWVTSEASAERIIALRFAGRAAPKGIGTAQTLICAFDPGVRAALWIGLTGQEQRLTVIIGPEPSRSPHYWHGEGLPPDAPFAIDLVIHAGMGPGGLLYRTTADAPWSSLRAASPWGAERLAWPRRWSVGHGQHGGDDRPFRGTALEISMASRDLPSI